MKTVRKPVRMCVACREHITKIDLIRIARSPDGTVSINGKSNGRGAYFCGKRACLQRMIKAKSLERAFKTQIPQEIYDRLEELCDE